MVIEDSRAGNTPLAVKLGLATTVILYTCLLSNKLMVACAESLLPTLKSDGKSFHVSAFKSFWA